MKMALGILFFQKGHWNTFGEEIMILDTLEILIIALGESLTEANKKLYSVQGNYIVDSSIEIYMPNQRSSVTMAELNVKLNDSISAKFLLDVLKKLFEKLDGSVNFTSIVHDENCINFTIEE